MSIKSNFSGKLFQYRKCNGLTQQKMAELCGVSLRHYQDLEMGRSMPNLTNAVLIAAKLDISLDSLKSEVNSDSVSVSVY